MAHEEIIIQILLITIGMIGLSEILNRIFGLDMNSARELREKAKEVQDRMRMAQSTRDVEEMRLAQQESVNLYKQMMKKQMIPSCLRCIVFFGIFAVIGIFYADYAADLLPFPILFFGSGWFAVYFLFSIAFQLIIYGIKKLYRKYTGKEGARKASREITGMLQQQGAGGQFQLTRPIPPKYLDEKSDVEPTDSWKDKIKRD